MSKIRSHNRPLVSRLAYHRLCPLRCGSGDRLFTAGLYFRFSLYLLLQLCLQSLWVVIILHAGINAGDNANEVIFPGLSGADWQIPAYLAMFLLSIVLGIIMWRRNQREKLVVTPIQ